VKGKDKKVSEYKDKLENIDLQVPESIKTLTPLLKEISKEFGFKYGEFLEYSLEHTKEFTGNPVNQPKFSKSDVFKFDAVISMIVRKLEISPRVKDKDKKVSEYKDKLENIDLQVPESIKTLTPLLKEISKEFGFKYGEFLDYSLEHTKEFTGNPVNQPKFSKSDTFTFDAVISMIVRKLVDSPRVKGKDKKVSEYKDKLENIDLQVPESIKTLTPLLKEISKEFGFKYDEFLEYSLEHTKEFTGNPVNKVNSNKGRNVTRRKASPTSMNDIRKQMAEMNELSNQMTKIRVRSNLEV
jgi:hypothetical protein